MNQKATFCKHFAAILQRPEAVKNNVTGYLICLAGDTAEKRHHE